MLRSQLIGDSFAPLYSEWAQLENALGTAIAMKSIHSADCLRKICSLLAVHRARQMDKQTATQDKGGRQRNG